MIDIVFKLGPDVILVKIDGNSILFGNTSQGPMLTNIDGLKLSKSGVMKEFPDLKGRDDWEKEAAKRFKEKIKSLKSERERANYIIGDLLSHGYQPWKLQVSGHRPEDITKWDS